MNSKIIELKNLSYSYNGKVIADNLTWELSDSSFVTFLMPYKSNNLFEKLLSGIIKPDSGDIKIDNISLQSIDYKNKSIHVIFKGGALFETMNVLENVSYGLSLLDLKEEDIRKKSMRMLKKLGISELMDKMPSMLLEDEIIKVALARVLVLKPKVIVFDDVLSKVDAYSKSQMQLFLRDLQRELAIPFIYVTHNKDDAFNISDKIVVFYRGRIIQEGTTLDLYYKPVSEGVALLVGNANVFHGRVSKEDSTGKYIKIKNNYLKLKHIDVNVGDKITIILRPENTKFIKETTRELLKAAIYDYEFNGQFIKTYAFLGEQKIESISLSSSRLPIVGEKVFIDFDEGSAIILKKKDE